MSKKPTIANINDNVQEMKDTDVSDVIQNLITNLGTEKNKHSFSSFEQRYTSWDWKELRAMYRSDWLSRKIVDIIAEDMTRKWRKFAGEIDPSYIQKLEKEEKRLQLKHKFCEAQKLARLHGGALLVMNIEGTGDIETPLNLDDIKPDSLRNINVLDSTRVSHQDPLINFDPLSPNFGLPEYYQIAGGVVYKIHHSRVIRFDGHMIPWDEFKENRYWHDSVLSVMYDSALNLASTTQNIAGLVHEANVDVVKIDNFMNMVSNRNTLTQLTNRFTTANLVKSMSNMLLLDSKEDYEKKTASFSGLEETARLFLTIVSAASSIPETVLLGQDAAGFSDGQSSRDNYIDMITSRQETDFNPKLDYFDQIMTRNLGLDIDFDSDELRYDWVPLKALDPNEDMERQVLRADMHSIYMEHGVLTEEVVIKELKDSGDFSNLDDEAMDKAITLIEQRRDLEKRQAETDISVSKGKAEDNPDDGTGKKSSDEPSNTNAKRTATTIRRQSRNKETVREKRRTQTKKQKSSGLRTKTRLGGGEEKAKAPRINSESANRRNKD